MPGQVELNQPQQGAALWLQFQGLLAAKHDAEL